MKECELVVVVVMKVVVMLLLLLGKEDLHTANQLGELKLQLNAIPHLPLHHLLRYGSRRAVDDFQAKGELVQQTRLLQLVLLQLRLLQDGSHLPAMVEEAHAVVCRYALVEKHGSEFGVHDAVVNHAVDCALNVPREGVFVVDQALESARRLVEACPDPASGISRRISDSRDKSTPTDPFVVCVLS